MIQTFELGPRLGISAPAFTVQDHARSRQQLDRLIGQNGLILGFIGDIWQPASVRRIIWLQRHAPTFIRQGCKLALLICDEPHMLYGFYASSPIPPEFPLLADVDGSVHRLFNMSRTPGMVLLDRNRIIRHKWLMPDERVWPRIHDIQEVLEAINA